MYNMKQQAQVSAGISVKWYCATKWFREMLG